MISNAADTELHLVLAMIVVLLIFGFVAVGVFVRVWRKERRKSR